MSGSGSSSPRVSLASGSSVAVVVACYNQAALLPLLFASLARQTVSDFQVILADDGSSDHTEQLVDQPATPFALSWITQPDCGYRKSKILNQVLRQTRADYLIFLDGDVFLEAHFLEDHLSLRRPGAFVAGRRVDLNQALTEQVLQQFAAAQAAGAVPAWLTQLEERLPWMALQEGLRPGGGFDGWRQCKRSLRVVAPFWRKLLGYDLPLDLLGSNWSGWREDVLAVNGFNEALEAYWGEDGDLFARLIHAKRQVIGVKSQCLQVHLFHPRRVPDPKHQCLYQERLQDLSYVWAKEGVR